MQFFVLLFIVFAGLVALWGFAWTIISMVKKAPTQPKPRQVKPNTDGTTLIAAGASIPIVPLLLTGVAHETSLPIGMVVFSSTLYIMMAVAFIIYILCTRNVVFPWDFEKEEVDNTKFIK